MQYDELKTIAVPVQDFTKVFDGKRHTRKKVNVNCSYTYNGGVIIDGVLYAGYECLEPILSPGDKLVPLSTGLQLNSRPPTREMMLVRADKPQTVQSPKQTLQSL